MKEVYYNSQGEALSHAAIQQKERMAQIDDEFRQRMRRVITGCVFKYNERSSIKSVGLPAINDSFVFQQTILPGAVDEKFATENLPIVDVNHERNKIICFNRPDRLNLYFKPDGVYFNLVPLWTPISEGIYDELDRRGSLGVSATLKTLALTETIDSAGVSQLKISKVQIESFSILTTMESAFPSATCKFSGQIVVPIGIFKR